MVVVDWPFSPRPEPATVAGDSAMLWGRRKLVMALALPPPIGKLYWDFFLSSDLLVLTSSEVKIWRGLDDWLGDEVRSAFAPGESRIIFQDGQLQGWRDYPFKNNLEPLETTLADCSPQQIAALVAWLDDPTLPPPGTAEQRREIAANPLAWAKLNGEGFLGQAIIKAQKNAPAHDGTEAIRG